ncbi:hypothetical protein [Oryzobacter telluris]|uniref:hypothetical protein n=1 Tax=Oryzobacter telluris TaxID=3149179 RepID=UPI00370DD302
MSSSDDRRRPRVAGHRRRPRQVERETTTAPGADAPADDLTPATAPAPTEAPPATAQTEPTAVTTDGPGTDTDDDEQAVERRGVPRPLLAPLVALVASLALLAGVAAVSLQDPGAADRDARAATAAARADLEQLLSYDHQTLEKQAASNAALLTGSFRDEYANTMRTTILPVATKEKAVVRARTYEAGVMAQTADTVTVQVFLNQAKTSEGQEQPSVDQNRVIATMQRVGERWLIARLVAY